MAKKSAESYPGQRNKEKHELFKRFQHRAIADVYKGRLFGLFDWRCFKCGAPEKPAPEIGKPPILCIDHHIPMAMGGHLVPGNLVALCRGCNNRKLDSHPESFYSQAELDRLSPILAQQEALFSFSFDWNAWHEDRAAYFLRLGVDAALVKELMFNPDHPEFIGQHPD